MGWNSLPHSAVHINGWLEFLLEIRQPLLLSSSTWAILRWYFGFELILSSWLSDRMMEAIGDSSSFRTNWPINHLRYSFNFHYSGSVSCHQWWWNFARTSVEQVQQLSSFLNWSEVPISSTRGSSVFLMTVEQVDSGCNSFESWQSSISAILYSLSFWVANDSLTILQPHYSSAFDRPFHSFPTDDQIIHLFLSFST